MNKRYSKEEIQNLEKRVSDLEDTVKKCIVNSMLSKGGKPLLTMAEASELLGLKKQTISLLVSKGKIPFYKPNGKNLYFDPEELNAWLRHRPDVHSQHEERPSSSSTI